MKDLIAFIIGILVAAVITVGGGYTMDKFLNKNNKTWLRVIYYIVSLILAVIANIIGMKIYFRATA